MINLLKTDLIRIFKDKLFLVACIVAGGFALTTPLLNKFLLGMMGEVDEGVIGEIGMNARSMFFNSFSMGNNFGMIAPILIGIILCKDFSFGTIRNKVISGKSRTAIFVSLFLACFTALCILIFAHAIVTLGVSLLLFEYQSGTFGIEDFGYLMASCGLELIVLLFVAAFLSFLCVFMKNAGTTVVLYVAVSFLLAIVGTVMLAALSFVDPAQEFVVNLLEFMKNANIFIGGYIGFADYTLGGVASVILGNVIGATIFVLLGIAVFRKKDIK